MEPIKRKRITRVGSGAFSIYLPKKWIDDWVPEQREHREVDLHRIGESFLIAPVITDRRVEAAIDPDKRSVRRWLLSAYVRGAVDVHLTPTTGTFDNDAIAAARDFIRHLDERLVAACGAKAVGFTLDPELPPPAADGADVLRAMGAKVVEMVGLADDAVRSYGVDPDRSLHALSLLRRIYTEDASRYLHQAMRMVATIELPLETVSDFQLLDLVSADLHRMADGCLQIARTIANAYGLELDDLAYPRDHLLQRIEQNGGLTPLDGITRQIVHTYPRGFAEVAELLERLRTALAEADVEELAVLIGESYAAKDRIQQRIFEAVVASWGEGDVGDPAGVTAAFTAYQLSVPLADILGALSTTARHGLGLLTAAPRGTA